MPRRRAIYPSSSRPSLTPALRVVRARSGVQRCSRFAPRQRGSVRSAWRGVDMAGRLFVVAAQLAVWAGHEANAGIAKGSFTKHVT